MKAKTGCWPCIVLILILADFQSSGAQAIQLPDFTHLVEHNSAAVVNISTTLKITGSVHGRQGIPDIPEDSPLYDFFKRFFGDSPDGRIPFPEGEQTSLGSGFIISGDGHIITNNHVIKDADEIIVRLVDRREYTAEVVGADEQSDIAVLKVDGKDLPIVTLGDSDKLKVGEWVMAIGSPFQFDHSVTAGIVSAKGRPLPNENYIPFIQTDVAINPGNSGGPLFNLNGEVVGVNSQIYSRTGGFMGLSFAVPINLVKRVYHQLKEEGHVTRGWLGVWIQAVDRELAESFGMEIPQGALVTKVIAGSPAATAGFEIGDIVVQFDNREVINDTDLPPMVGNTEVGKKVPVQVIRKGKQVSLNVVIDTLPEDANKLASKPPEKPESSGTNKLNITVTDLTDDERKELDLDHGIRIEDVTTGPASRAGLRAGDILLLVNNQKVINVKEFERIISSLPKDKPVAILVQRNGNPIFLALRQDSPDG